MCVALPGKVIRTTGEIATIDFGGGTKKDVNVSLIDAKTGQYVLVHAGFAITVINEKAAQDTLKSMERIK